MANAAYYGAKPKHFKGSASLNFPSISAGAGAELTIAVTGAVVGDAVALAPPASIEAGLCWSGRVSAAGVVTIRVVNATAAPVDPAAATWGVTVIRA